MVVLIDWFKNCSMVTDFAHDFEVA
jgi:hypothetical protein